MNRTFLKFFLFFCFAMFLFANSEDLNEKEIINNIGLVMMMQAR